MRMAEAILISTVSATLVVINWPSSVDEVSQGDKTGRAA